MQYIHVRLVTALFVKQTPCTGAHIQTLYFLLTSIGLRQALLLNEHHLLVPSLFAYEHFDCIFWSTNVIMMKMMEWLLWTRLSLIIITLDSLIHLALDFCQKRSFNRMKTWDYCFHKLFEINRKPIQPFISTHCKISVNRLFSGLSHPFVCLMDPFDWW